MLRFMSGTKRCLFLHGFEGVPTGRKTVFLREQLGYEVIAPEMGHRGWAFEDHVGVVLDELDRDPTINLVVGSSLGAFAGAVAAGRRPGRPLRLVLLATAVGVHEAWARQMGTDGMGLWRDEGRIVYRHLGIDQDIELPYAMWTGCRDAEGVQIEHPCVLIHGKHDEVIPVEHAVALAKRSPGVGRLNVVSDGHRLLESLDVMAEAVRSFQ
jgi:pimeloyl-ACP methyl ester carboxylesterase